MTTFFLNRLATEPHALAFAGQSTPWPVALADQTTDPSLDEALRGHIAASNRLLTPVAADLLTTTGRPVDLFGFKPNPARLGAAAAATVSTAAAAAISRRPKSLSCFFMVRSFLSSRSLTVEHIVEAAKGHHVALQIEVLRALQRFPAVRPLEL